LIHPDCGSVGITETMNNRNGAKILITGADGFIGSHLADALVRQGAEVTALALYNSFDSYGWIDDLEDDVRGSMSLVRGDVRDGHQMASLCKGQDVVFHLAALIAVPYSYDAPSSYVATNVQGTLNVLKGALEGGASRFVNTSTSEVYGTARFTPITEEHPLQGQSPYSASKIAADAMTEAFARSFRLPAITLRPFNTYGPRQSERAVISTVIRQALDDKCEAISLGDLSPSRDFNFVSDTVEALIKTAELGDQHLGKTFNTGSGRMISIAGMVEIIREITGCSKPVIEDEIRKRPADSEVLALMADSSRLTDAAGWKPAVGLEEGLRKTIEWWRGRMDKVRPGAGYIV